MFPVSDGAKLYSANPESGDEGIWICRFKVARKIRTE